MAVSYTHLDVYKRQDKSRMVYREIRLYGVSFFVFLLIIHPVSYTHLAVVLIGIRWPIISLYNITPEVARDVSLCILIFAAYII